MAEPPAYRGPGYGDVNYAPKHEELDPKYDIEKPQEDAVFGEVVEGGPNYRAVGWKGTSVLMMKTQIGLGILSLPSAFDTLGLIPGVICLIAIAVITGWSSWIVGVFKLRHPEVYGIEDVGEKLFGRVGREFFGLAFALYWTFVGGSAMLGISIALNALSTHATCTAVYVAVAAVIGFGLCSIQTLGRISWLAWVGLIGILSGVMTLTIAVAVEGRPSTAPKDGPWKSDFKLFGSPSFGEATAALCTLIFAYGGVPAFFNIVSEMRRPEHYTRALIVCQTVMTVLYIVVGVVVYYYCGSFVASPALGSAGPLLKKVCYGLALPGLIVSMTLVCHITAKYFFIRFFRGTKHLNHNTMIHWVSWLGLTGAVCIVAYIIASAIPNFGALVSLIGALFGTLMTFQSMGMMWFYDHWTKGKAEKSTRWMSLVFWAGFIIASGTFLMIAGTYGSVLGIKDTYSGSNGPTAWSCADNSNST
ncbi:transmembrane amino acid transporter [Aaosphaeria arxii CBS 175.79]|uniref:Transmembrane amino acid transporter n=1 Tax=Aaosphaeria arxii CBS 175.79 TaxID=1450172 RepID=A0A6A5X8Z6_9PLEO|nr:transmembrane amino acid transporter [Aaosphaeria arxii CBS 175.79]KAF2009393.1 transmembrane amino acid transporter [Aaosphaeria arxii CBS 175.79]